MRNPKRDPNKPTRKERDKAWRAKAQFCTAWCPSIRKCGWQGDLADCVMKKGEDFMGDYQAPSCPKCGKFIEKRGK